MAKFEIIMPKLGESIIEATITRWVKTAGDQVEEDDSIVEIATDKVDSEIPSPVEGKLVETLYNEGDVPNLKRNQRMKLQKQMIFRQVTGFIHHW